MSFGAVAEHWGPGLLGLVHGGRQSGAVAASLGTADVVGERPKGPVQEWPRAVEGSGRVGSWQIKSCPKLGTVVRACNLSTLEFGS